jgi:hypothetical protein
MRERPDSRRRSTVFGTYGVVACEHSSAALTGIRILDDGGNAVDSCVAMAASMAALAPMTTGRVLSYLPATLQADPRARATAKQTSARLSSFGSA